MQGLTLASTVLACFLLAANTHAQQMADRPGGEEYLQLLDTIQPKTYPYLLPIWGQKAVDRGYTLPLSGGLSVQYLWQRSEIVIENLMVGFNGGEKYDLDDIVVFNSAESTSNGVNIRPDFWLFPFLNVYGILARNSFSTDIDITIRVPQGIGYTDLLNLATAAEFGATTVGFGLTPTMGIAGGFVAFDFNITWSDIEGLKEPAQAFVFGPRFGKVFKMRNPTRKMAVWVGGFRVNIRSETSGNLPLADLIPLDGIEDRIDGALQGAMAAEETLNTWWDGLTPAEKTQNAAKYGAGQLAIQKATDILVRLDDGVQNAEESTVQYELDKRQKEKWNFIVGGQFELNPSIMFRAEAGFLGSRTQFFGGIQYRFNL